MNSVIARQTKVKVLGLRLVDATRRTKTFQPNTGRKRVPLVVNFTHVIFVRRKTLKKWRLVPRLSTHFMGVQRSSLTTITRTQRGEPGDKATVAVQSLYSRSTVEVQSQYGRATVEYSPHTIELPSRHSVSTLELLCDCTLQVVLDYHTSYSLVLAKLT